MASVSRDQLTPADAVGQFLKSTISLTLPASEGIAYGATPLTRVWSEEIRIPERRRTSTIAFSVHAPTHLELPWAVAWSRWVEFLQKNLITRLPPEESSEEGIGLITALMKPVVVECLVIDVSYKRTPMLKLLEEARRQLRSTLSEEPVADSTLGREDFLRRVEIIPNLNSNRLQTLIEALCISEGEVQQAVSEYVRGHDPKRSMVVIKSQWDVFRPQCNEIRHPIWNCWHPYLLHPFLDEPAFDVLNRHGFMGIASDMPGIDCPLYGVAANWALPFALEVKRRILVKGSSGKVRLPRDGAFRPVKFGLLAKGKYYINNLRFPILHESASELGRFLTFPDEALEVSSYAGHLMIHPIALDPSIKDAIPVLVLFRRS